MHFVEHGPLGNPHVLMQLKRAALGRVARPEVDEAEGRIWGLVLQTEFQLALTRAQATSLSLLQARPGRQAERWREACFTFMGERGPYRFLAR